MFGHDYISWYCRCEGNGRKTARLTPVLLFPTAILLLSIAAPLEDDFLLAQDQPAVSLKEIASHVREYRDGIHSVKVDYSVHAKHPEGSPWESHYTWWQQGEKFLLSMKPVLDIRGEKTEQFFASYDGTHGYRVDWWNHDPSLIAYIHRDDFPPSMMGHEVVSRALGWIIFNSPDNLPDLLLDPTAVIVGQEDVEGFPCIRIRIDALQVAGQKKNYLEVWLDPARDYLPRVLQIVPKRITPELLKTLSKSNPFRSEEGEQSYYLVTTEFQSIRDNLLGTDRWLPRVIHAGNPDAYRVVVDTVELNATLKAAEFRPPLTTGAQIVDDIGLPQMKFSFVGGAKGESVFRERGVLSEQFLNPHQKSVSDFVTVDARTQWTSPIVQMLVIVGFLLLSLTTVWLLLRSRRANDVSRSF